MAKTTLSSYKVIPKILYHLLINSQIGLNKPKVRAKGINHPKYSVKPEYACFKHESATCVSL